jgi:RNA polymerase sigma factor (sigma-70 family)
VGTAAGTLSRSTVRTGFGPLALMSDGSLARAVGRGDQRAFELLYGRYRDQLYRYCSSIVRQPEDAEEALQSTMLRAYRALAEGERELTVRPWLYRIAHNECLRLLSRRPDVDVLGDLEEAVGERVEERAEVNEQLRQLRLDMAALPAEQRSALVLRELNGLSHQAIAEALGETPAAVKQLIYEARRALLEFGEGRALACADVRHRISDGDGRALRGRRVKAHIRGCTACHAFQSAMRTRPRQLAALVPVLPAAAAQRILEAVLSSVAGGGGGGGAMVAAGATAGASGATGLGTFAGIGAGGATAGLGGLMMKGAVAGVVALGAGSAVVVPQIVQTPTRAPARATGTLAPTASSVATIAPTAEEQAPALVLPTLEGTGFTVPQTTPIASLPLPSVLTTPPAAPADPALAPTGSGAPESGATPVVTPTPTKPAGTGTPLPGTIMNPPRSSGSSGSPRLEVPRLPLPQVGAPTGELPRIELPKLELPAVELPGLEVPPISVPVPTLELPPLTLPELLPGLQLPNITGTLGLQLTLPGATPPPPPPPPPPAP